MPTYYDDHDDDDRQQRELYASNREVYDANRSRMNTAIVVLVIVTILSFLLLIVTLAVSGWAGLGFVPLLAIGIWAFVVYRRSKAQSCVRFDQCQL